MAEVEPLRVPAMEELHPAREPGLARLDDQVNVVRHVDGAVHAPAVAALDFDEVALVRAVILVVREDAPPFDAARVDVVPAVGEARAKRTGHSPDGSRASARLKVAASDGSTGAVGASTGVRP